MGRDVSEVGPGAHVVSAEWIGDRDYVSAVDPAVSICLLGCGGL